MLCCGGVKETWSVVTTKALELSSAASADSHAWHPSLSREPHVGGKLKGMLPSSIIVSGNSLSLRHDLYLLRLACLKNERCVTFIHRKKAFAEFRFL